ncbi:MAG: DUF1190 domain-containing protein [Pseudomonadota bacterium]|nr:DUF1190 domain-containing protein [Pseudomonadota bacterium]
MHNFKSKAGTLAVGVSLLALAACEEPKVEASIFENVQQCISNGDATPEQCERNFREAKNQHAAVAPKYASLSDCQADFGAEKCEQAPYRTSTGGSVFMPLMAGYMMGSLLGGGRTMTSQPLYRSASSPGSFRTADNRNIGNKTGRAQVARSATSRPSVKTQTRSRGGFGSSGRRFGSGAT